jgi:putative transcriptional regulator
LPVSDQALQNALARIDRAEAEPRFSRPKRAKAHSFLARFSLPAALTPVEIGERYWAAPGVWIAPISFEDAPIRSKTFLMNVRAGMTMPQHTHRGSELTVVLSGRFADEMGRYAPGDFIVCDEDHSHSPTAIDDCLCLIASEAAIVMQTWLGKLVQPFARI